MAAVKLRWIEVTVAQSEALPYSTTAALLDAHLDQAAGVLQLLLDDMAKADGKWPDEVASFLAGSVAAAPFVTKVLHGDLGSPTFVQLVPAESLGYRFDEARMRTESRKLWSKAYPDFVRREYDDLAAPEIRRSGYRSWTSAFRFGSHGKNE